jgi:segregation and condensation protein A
MAGIDKNGQGQGPQAGPKETDGPENSANEGRAQDATDDAWAAMADRLPDEAAASLEDALIVDVDGFEGPLDFLLALARQQKLDLAKISILALAEQYLAFIERAKALRLELAADYLVMAAWLAYLKSRLLIPDLGADEEPSGEELAAILAFRLKKLEAMREAAGQLMDRPHLGKAFFLRGQPEDISLQRKPHFTASLYDLLTAYAAQRQRQSVSLVHVRKREVWSLQEARDVLVRLVGTVSDWMPVDELLRSYLKLGDVRSTALASSFAASLELVREGHLEIRQTEAFGTIYIRSPRGK